MLGITVNGDCQQLLFHKRVELIDLKKKASVDPLASTKKVLAHGEGTYRER